MHANLQRRRPAGLSRPDRRSARAPLGELAGELGGRLGGSPLWRDRAALVALLLAVLVNMALYVYVWRQQAELPPFFPVHYNGAGEVDQLGQPGNLFRLPMIGTLILLADTVLAALLHAEDPISARLLVAAALITELLLVGATLGLVARAFG